MDPVTAAFILAYSVFLRAISSAKAAFSISNFAF